jgi:hypothetical protein
VAGAFGDGQNGPNGFAAVLEGDGLAFDAGAVVRFSVHRYPPRYGDSAPVPKYFVIESLMTATVALLGNKTIAPFGPYTTVAGASGLDATAAFGAVLGIDGGRTSTIARRRPIPCGRPVSG